MHEFGIHFNIEDKLILINKISTFFSHMAQYYSPHSSAVGCLPAPFFLELSKKIRIGTTLFMPPVSTNGVCYGIDTKENQGEEHRLPYSTLLAVNS